MISPMQHEMIRLQKLSMCTLKQKLRKLLAADRKTFGEHFASRIHFELETPPPHTPHC